mgnify:CR=1 FL=1
MTNFNWQTPFGNPLIDWGITATLIIGSIIGAKVLYWILSKIVSKLTKKTKTNLDDLLLDMLEEPLAFSFGAIGIWKSICYLDMSESTLSSINNIFYLVAVGLVAWALTRTIEALIEEYLIPIVDKSESDLDDQLLPVLRKSIKGAIWVMAFIIGLNNAGYDVGAIIAGLGIGGLAFALAAQDSVKNLFGGFTIFIDKPFTVKDRVKVEGFDGSVEEIGLRSTRIRTLDGRRVTIPNSTFSESAIENVSSEPSRKVVLNLGLTYDTTETEIENAMATLTEIVSGVEGAAEKIITGFNAFNDSSLNIILIYYIEAGGDILGVQTRVNLNILKQFNSKKLEFAFPTQILHINN